MHRRTHEKAPSRHEDSFIVATYYDHAIRSYCDALLYWLLWSSWKDNMQKVPRSSPPPDLRDFVESLNSIVAALSGSSDVLEEAQGNEELLRAVRIHLKRQVVQLQEVTRRVEGQAFSYRRDCNTELCSTGVLPSPGGTEMLAVRASHGIC